MNSNNMSSSDELEKVPYVIKMRGTLSDGLKRYLYSSPAADIELECNVTADAINNTLHFSFVFAMIKFHIDADTATKKAITQKVKNDLIELFSDKDAFLDPLVGGTTTTVTFF